jgi:ABC-type oligopeptide transport system ATPase subunit
VIYGKISCPARKIKHEKIMSEIALEVKNLVKHFPTRGAFFQKLPPKVAVDDVSFSIARGKTLAIVGESGSGKTTVGMMLLGLLEVTSGQILFGDKPLSPKDKDLRRQMQVVFQDPYASLNARMTVAEALTEGMKIHGLYGDSKSQRAQAAKLLGQVGLPETALERYPHEFSGGQRQRIAIARALSVKPAFIVLDEPTSALDVSVQSQVLNLLRQLQRDNGLTYLFVTHNLAVVEYLADEVCVMERGKIVERGTIEQIFDTPQQEYTKKLLSAIPIPDPERRHL